MSIRRDFTSSSLVLITGANGHVAQHVLSELLSRPVHRRPRVRATVRSESSAAAVQSVFREHILAGGLEIVLIKDIAAPHAFDSAVQSCTHIRHIASPLVVSPKDTENDLLIPAIRGTLSLLQSAQHSSSLERVVITGSFVSVVDLAQDFRPGYTYTPSDWNPITYEQAADPNLDLTVWSPRWRPFITYMASKKLAEKAAWDFYERERPR